MIFPQKVHRKVSLNKFLIAFKASRFPGSKAAVAESDVKIPEIAEINIPESSTVPRGNGLNPGGISITPSSSNSPEPGQYAANREKRTAQNASAR